MACPHNHIRRGELNQDDCGKRASVESAMALSLLYWNQGTEGQNLKTQILAVDNARKAITTPGCENDNPCVDHPCSCNNCYLMFLANV